ncbi:MAG: Gfo/Idh/MocA family oxidoreductase [Spirochaetes bacterium]|nr:Gfo/Idh/MocA family oxidoreductase [Spirochaetota bacterium]
MPLLSREADEIRVAVAGLGKMGGYHARALRELSAGGAEAYYKGGLAEQVAKIRLVGLCDRSPERAAAFPGVPFFGDFAELLASARPDLVVIATPSATHFSLGMEALRGGCHAFIEKPVAGSLAEWNAMAEAARQGGLRLMAGHVERYNPVAIKIRQLLRDGAWAPRAYAFRRCQPHDPRIPDDIVTDKLIHDLDLALYFFGPVTGWEILDSRVEAGKVQELRVSLRHGGGVGGELFISWLLPGPEKVRSCRLELGDGEAALGDFSAKTLSLGGVPVEIAVPGWVKPDNNQVKDELADFVGHSMEPLPEGPIEPLLSPGEITHATALIEQIGRGLRRRPA